MFFSVFNYLKKRKETENNKDLEKNKTNKDEIDISIKQKEAKKNINKKTSSNTKKNKQTKRKNNEKEQKVRKKSKLSISRFKEKRRKKFLKRKEKKKRKDIAFPIYYQLILDLVIIVVILNVFINAFSMGYKIEGKYIIDGDKYLFVPTLSTLNLAEYSNFRELEKDDNIYIYYDRRTDGFKYSLNRKFLAMNIKGTVYKKTDYYLYINFDFENEINKDSYYISKYSTSDTFKVTLKKFLSNYVIDEPIKDAIMDDIKNTYKEFLE